MEDHREKNWAWSFHLDHHVTAAETALYRFLFCGNCLLRRKNRYAFVRGETRFHQSASLRQKHHNTRFLQDSFHHADICGILPFFLWNNPILPEIDIHPSNSFSAGLRLGTFPQSIVVPSGALISMYSNPCKKQQPVAMIIVFGKMVLWFFFLLINSNLYPIFYKSIPDIYRWLLYLYVSVLQIFRCNHSKLIPYWNCWKNMELFRMNYVHAFRKTALFQISYILQTLMHPLNTRKCTLSIRALL